MWGGGGGAKRGHDSRAIFTEYGSVRNLYNFAGISVHLFFH